MYNNKLNLRNIYIDLLNKIIETSGVDEDYVDTAISNLKDYVDTQDESVKTYVDTQIGTVLNTSF